MSKNLQNLLNKIDKQERSRLAGANSAHSVVLQSKRIEITPQPRDTLSEPSAAQRRLWFLSKQPSSSAAYHIPLKLKILGEIELDVFAKALALLVARHESLRSVFVDVEGEPKVKICDLTPSDYLVYKDFSDTHDSEHEAQQSCIAALNTPFDIEQGPLIRFNLYTIGEQEHIMFIVQHHMISDGWSQEIIQRDMLELYDALLQDRAPTLPSLSVQYLDFAHWQAQYLSCDKGQASLAYWLDDLSNCPLQLVVPSDRQRPSEQSFDGQTVTLSVFSSQVQALREVSAKNGSTLCATVMSAWYILLARLSGQNDLVVGMPMANRESAVLEPQVGYFSNTVPIRVENIAQQSASDLIAYLNDKLLKAQTHQNVPFDLIVEKVNPPRSLSHPPIFQFMFAWQNFVQASQQELSLSVEPSSFQLNKVKFDLELQCFESQGALDIELNYASALFNRETAERYLGYLQNLLREIVNDAKMGITDINYLGADEAGFLCASGTGRTLAFPAQTTLHSVFESQVKESPEAIALQQDSQAFTYDMLNRQANQLAGFLLDSGLKQRNKVVVYGQRTPEFVCMMLAVLKAGACYIPLDATTPINRVKAVYEDSGAAFLLAVGVDISKADIDKEQYIAWEHQQATWSNYPTDNIVLATKPISASDPAYAIYTSGSTGTPKGVMVSHRSVMNLVTWAQNTYQITRQDRLLQNLSLSFDASVVELYSGLLSGASVIMTTQQWLYNRDTFYSNCEKYNVSMIATASAIWRQLTNEHGPLNIPQSIRCILVGGEPMCAAALKKWFATQGWLPDLYNVYGPTEATVISSTQKVQPDSDWRSIGKPIDNYQMCVLDAQKRQVGIGVVGEIYIAGQGVAIGYVNRPDVTAECFLPCPFTSEAGSRMYRTGDLGYFTHSGELVCVGRMDGQLKVRGVRIELKEIELQLGQLPEVASAHVTTFTTPLGEKDIIAYVVAKEDGEDSTQLEHAIRSRLSAILPDNMIPKAFVFLASLPMTGNGKLDERALPAYRKLPERSTHSANPTEAILLKLYQELLADENIGLEDSFFELGGHSLLAMRLIGKIRAALGVEVSTSTFFKSPTVAQLAIEVTQAKKTSRPALRAFKRK